MRSLSVTLLLMPLLITGCNSHGRYVPVVVNTGSADAARLEKAVKKLSDGLATHAASVTARLEALDRQQRSAGRDNGLEDEIAALIQVLNRPSPEILPGVGLSPITHDSATTIYSFDTITGTYRVAQRNDGPPPHQ